MKINLNLHSAYYNKPQINMNNNFKAESRYNSQPYDTVSFSAMKKFDFKGLNLLVVEKFKAPIEKFKNISDFQNWAKSETDNILNKDYKGRREATGALRQKQLKEWADYILNENEIYTASTALFILSSITSGLLPENDKVLPSLNKGVLADTINDIENRLNSTPRLNINFNKEYETFLKAFYNNKDVNSFKTQTGWVIIPSKQKDSENFESNVKKLKAMSHKNWCTKSLNARLYLLQGDFHVYMVNGEPKVGIRFKEDVIQEVQGECNNGKIPITHLENIKEHINLGQYSLSHAAQHEVDVAEKTQKILNEIKEEIAKNGKYDIIKILDCLDFRPEQDQNGNITLSHYILPEDFTLKEFGLKESDLFNRITCIKGDAYFFKSEMTTLGALKNIGGSLNIWNSNITSLENLKYIGADANFENSRIKTLGNLEKIGGNAYFSESQIEDLGQLEYIGGTAFFDGTKYITNLGNLKYVGKDLYLDDTNISDLGKLEYIGGDAVFINSPKLKSLKNVKTINGNADFADIDLEDLGNLTKIGGNACFAASKIQTLAKLEEIGGYAIFNGSLQPLRFFESIIDNLIDFSIVYEMLYDEKDASYYNSQIKNIGNLKSIAGIPVMTYLLTYYPDMLLELK